MIDAAMAKHLQAINARIDSRPIVWRGDGDGMSEAEFLQIVETVDKAGRDSAREIIKREIVALEESILEMRADERETAKALDVFLDEQRQKKDAAAEAIEMAGAAIAGAIRERVQPLEERIAELEKMLSTRRAA